MKALKCRRVFDSLNPSPPLDHVGCGSATTGVGAATQYFFRIMSRTIAYCDPLSYGSFLRPYIGVWLEM